MQDQMHSNQTFKLSDPSQAAPTQPQAGPGPLMPAKTSPLANKGIPGPLTAQQPSPNDKISVSQQQ